MVDDRERNQSGQYDDRLPPERVLDVFDRREDRARPVTAGDVVDAIDVSRRTALNKLNELVAGGTVDSRTVGARARVFWRPIVDGAHERGEQRAPERRESAESTPAGDTAAETPAARERPESTPAGASTIDGDALGLDADRRDAVQAMYEYLREHGTARKSDFTSDVYPEHPAGYGSAAGWWNALGTGSTTADSKGALADVAGVKKPPSGRPTWTYTGE